MSVRQEGWFAAALAVVQRIHAGRMTDAEPHWKWCESAALLLSEADPAATRDDIEAEMLRDVFQVHGVTEHTLRALGVRKPVIHMLLERGFQ